MNGFNINKMQTTLHKQQNQTENDNQQLESKISVQKKKFGVLKKLKVASARFYSNIDIKHVVNINDVCFVNESALRNPQDSEQTLLKTLFHYKMISKVTLNNSFVNIELKKCQENYLPPEYFFERLRSFGDVKMANIANHLQTIQTQFSSIKEQCPLKVTSFTQSKEESMLQTFLQKMEGKKYFLYFTQISPHNINLKNIILSVPLLNELGYNIKKIAIDFLKYKHILFQIFSAKNYTSFLEQCFDNFAQIQNKTIQNPNMSQQEKEQMTSFEYKDEIIKTKQDEMGFFQQLNDAKVRWFSPHPSVCCFEILDIVENSSLNLLRKPKTVKYEKNNPALDIQTLKRSGLMSSLLEIEETSVEQNEMDVTGSKRVKIQ